MIIYLIGFMGSGKSYLAKELAALTHSAFIDLDQVIVKHEGVSISGIFENNGESYFRNLESDLLRSITQDVYKPELIRGEAEPNRRAPLWETFLENDHRCHLCPSSSLGETGGGLLPMPRPMPERSGNINDAIELKLADSKVPPQSAAALACRTEPKLNRNAQCRGTGCRVCRGNVHTIPLYINRRE